MIVIVAGDAEWPKVRATLSYFHHRDRYSGIITSSPAARRWAMETGLRVIEQEPIKALNRLDYARVHAIGRAGPIAEMARQRGRRVVETP